MIPIELLEDYLIDQEDGLKRLLTWFLNLVMQFEAMEQINAEPYERVDSRKAHRNGYKERSLKTRVGELRLKKPQFREISFETKVFDRYSRVEKALINAVIESYLHGVLTRRIQDIVSRLGIEDSIKLILLLDTIYHIIILSTNEKGASILPNSEPT